MTVQQQTPINRYTGNGVTTVYATNFKALAKGDVGAWIDGSKKTVDVDFSVSGLGADTGFAVTWTTAPANLTNVVIARQSTVQRLTDYQTLGDFNTSTVNPDFDNSILVLQELKEADSRSFQLPVTDPSSALPDWSTVLALPNRKGKYFGYFNAVTGAPELLSVLPSGTPLSQSIIGALLYPLTVPEGAAPAIPTNYGYPAGDARRDGVVIDTGADQITALNALLALPTVAPLFAVIPDGSDVTVSSTPTNVYGKRIGPGRVLKTITGGTQQINSDADDHQHVFGMEYLYQCHNKLAARGTFSALFSGDSTTAGDAIVSSSRLLHRAVQQCVADRGALITTATNAGHSGLNTEQWRTTYLAGDIASNPDLMVLRWGINDPAFGRTISDFTTSLRSALTTIRASKSLSQMGIILMTPNSTSDTPNLRDEKWYERVRRVVKQAARDYQCACIDTYAIWRDSRSAATLWMDNAYGDGRAIHPLDVMNGWIAGKIAELIVPTGVLSKDIYFINGTPAVTEVPSHFSVGISSYGVSWSVSGQTITGAVFTYRHPDGVVKQEIISSTVALLRAWRMGDAVGDTWSAWVLSKGGGALTDLTPGNSWTLAAGTGNAFRWDCIDGVVQLRGRLTGGTTTSGTVIANIPSGFRPPFDSYKAVLCGASLNTAAVINISSTGDVIVISCSSNALLDVGCSWTTR